MSLPPSSAALSSHASSVTRTALGIVRADERCSTRRAEPGESNPSDAQDHRLKRLYSVRVMVAQLPPDPGVCTARSDQLGMSCELLAAGPNSISPSSEEEVILLRDLYERVDVL